MKIQAKRVLIMSPMTIKRIKYLMIITLIFSFQIAKSEPAKDIKLKKFIDKSELIIKGKLIEKYSRVEDYKGYTIQRNGEITKNSVNNGIYTTYIFKIIEIMKGKYDEKTIKIVRKGGCSKKLNICKVSTMDYDYSKNQVGVLLLNYRYKTKIFQSMGTYSTAYILEKNSSLVSTRYFNESKINHFDKNQSALKNNFTLNQLKTLIQEVKESNEE